MAGIKNIYQQYGVTPFSPVQGDNIFDRHMQFQLQEYTPYCQFCGREIINSSKDEHGHNVDPEWERLNRAHYRCYAMRSRGY